jgi:hypothetical protein
MRDCLVQNDLWFFEGVINQSAKASISFDAAIAFSYCQSAKKAVTSCFAQNEVGILQVGMFLRLFPNHAMLKKKPDFFARLCRGIIQGQFMPVRRASRQTPRKTNS